MAFKERLIKSILGIELNDKGSVIALNGAYKPKEMRGNKDV